MLQYYYHHILRDACSGFGHNIITLLTPLTVGILVRFMILMRASWQLSLSTVPVGLDGAPAPTFFLCFFWRRNLYVHKLTHCTHFDFEDGGSMYFQDVSNTANIRSM
jgi:hypothetical protein